MFLDRCFCHCESIMSALEMIRLKIEPPTIGRSALIPGSNAGKVLQNQKFNKGILLNLHRNMLTVKDDAMLIVIHIWGILKSPGTVIYSDRNDSVILSGRMINSSCISFVLRAKKTFRITAGFYKLGSSDCLRIFSGLERLMVISILPYSLSTVHF